MITTYTTMTPAMMPITAAAHGATNAHGAVMATRPASNPFAVMDGSGFPNFRHITNIAAKQPKADARIVFTMTTVRRRSVPANVEPPLKPIHPTRRTNVPRTAIGRWWPGIALGDPSLLNLPIRGPSIFAPQNAATPPIACTTPDPAKSSDPCPHFGPIAPSCDSQPPPQTQFPKIG